MARNTAPGCRELMGEKQVVYMEDDSVPRPPDLDRPGVPRRPDDAHPADRACPRQGLRMSEALRGSRGSWRTTWPHSRGRCTDRRPSIRESALPITSRWRGRASPCCAGRSGELTLEGGLRTMPLRGNDSRGLPGIPWCLWTSAPTPIAKMFLDAFLWGRGMT